MSKQQVCQELINQGYPAVFEGGIVMFLYEKGEDTNALYQKYSETLKAIGYGSSWGLRCSEGSSTAMA